MPSLIFDLDQTLIDSRLAEEYRKKGDWASVYNRIKSFVLYDGILELLQYAKDNDFKICIVTNSPSIYCLKVLQYWSIPYNCMVCYHDVRYRKPHPEPMIKAIQMLGDDPSSILSLGDRDVDIKSSKAAGIATIGCSWGTNVDEKNALISESPTFFAETPSDALFLIKEFFTLKNTV